MKYKMIAIDMDGTLLTDKKEVTEVSKEAIRKASKKGIKIVVCTGRIFTSAKVYAKEIGTEAPIIASNGAYIREKDAEKIIYEKPIAKDKLKVLVDMAKSEGFFPHLFTTNTIYTEKLIFSSKSYTKWNEGLPETDKVIIEIVDDLNQCIDESDLDFLKMVVMCDDIDKLLKLKQRISDNMDVSVMSSVENNFEVMEAGISKGNGVKALAEYYGIDRSEVVCIGDNENDISMIEYAGLGVAMGNATEDLKSAADIITETNDNDGVARFIEEYILKGRA